MENVLTNLHCLQRMRTPFELQNDFSVDILGLSKFFREDAAVTVQTMQIGNRPCRIYGEAHAEYLLLQMTGEHEQQSMESEVPAIAQSAHHFLFAAIPVESWNDALSPWKSPAVWGKQGFGGNAADTLRPHTESAVSPPGERQNHSGWLLAGGIVCAVGIHPDRFVLRCRRCIPLGVVSGLDGV